jgi:hypothetical protein
MGCPCVTLFHIRSAAISCSNLSRPCPTLLLLLLLLPSGWTAEPSAMRQNSAALMPQQLLVATPALLNGKSRATRLNHPPCYVTLV